MAIPPSRWCRWIAWTSSLTTGRGPAWRNRRRDFAWDGRRGSLADGAHGHPCKMDPWVAGKLPTPSTARFGNREVRKHALGQSLPPTVGYREQIVVLASSVRRPLLSASGAASGVSWCWHFSHCHCAPFCFPKTAGGDRSEELASVPTGHLGPAKHGSCDAGDNPNSRARVVVGPRRTSG